LKRQFDYYALLWRSNNRTELNAVASHAMSQDRATYERLAQEWSVPSLAIIESGNTIKGAELFCTDFTSGIQSGERNIAKRTPRSSELLHRYLIDHPLPKLFVDRQNMTTGCLKQSFNKGGDLDDAQAICDCVTTVMFSELTQSQRDDFNATARAGQDVQSLLFMTELWPKLTRCSTIE
jgi:hypothetical protein